MKATELIDLAIADGCKTVEDFTEWGYINGRISALKEMEKKIAAVNEAIVPEMAVNTIPDYMNAAIAQGVENEK